MVENCNHDNLELGEQIGTRVQGDRGLPRQVAFRATCQDCRSRVTVDYNIAFIDGDRA